MHEIDSQLSDYDFTLPPELIATRALEERSASKLLCLGKDDKHPTHDVFSNLEKYLKSGDVLVVNNTKVMKARIYAYKATGGRVEILLVRPHAEGRWAALMNGSGPFLPGMKLSLGAVGHPDSLEVIARLKEEPGLYEIFSACDLAKHARQVGEMPLPPYFGRKADDNDEQRYQTVYALDQTWGAVAAPTAGLHFTQEHLEKLASQGIILAQTTLHVGPGTFLPIRVDNIADHKMHVEYFSMNEETALVLNQARQRKSRIVVVGSTALRVVEQVMLWAHEKNSQDFFACEGKTSLFIRPGYKFLACDAMITNFHIPRSTLFVLIAAVVGRERALAAYEEAISRKYRFFSYGDACYFEMTNKFI
jgi:S-adenosylmethionine:tRNA ribosyltransferase-isomerase